MADAPSSRSHILRPHHVVIAGCFLLVAQPQKGWSDNFLKHLYTLIMREISDIYKPLPYWHFRSALLAIPKNSGLVGLMDSQDAEYMCDSLSAFIKAMTHPNILLDLYKGLESLIWDRTELTSPALFERRSFFGIFIRRVRLSIQKLSYAGAVQFVDDFQGWIAASHMNGYANEGNLPAQGVIIHSAPDDSTPRGTAQALVDYEASIHIGDLTTGMEHLRRFFAQRFSEDTDSGFNQYALLRLASTHYVKGQLPAAKWAVEEAMKVCRNNADRYTLISCTALWRRITAFYPDHEPSSLKKGFRQLEVLWDLRRSIESGEPISACWKFLWQASAGAKDLSDGGRPRDRASMTTASSFMWRLSGIGSLGTLWEHVSLLNVDEGPEDIRLTNILSQAVRLARQGQYDESFASMLNPTTWRGLTLAQVHQWQFELWCNLHVFASRSQRKGLDEYIRRTMPSYPPQQNYQGGQIILEKGNLGVFDCLRKGAAYITAKQYLQALSPVLVAATLSEYAGMWDMHRTAIIMIADLGIALGMAPSGQRLIEDHLPQILRGEDLEQRAYGCFTLARCMISNAEGDVSKLPDAIPWLERALVDYTTIQLLQPALNVLYVTAVLYENIGETIKRDQVSGRFRVLSELVTSRRTKAIEQKYMDIIQIAGEVGAFVASGGQKAAEQQ